MEENWQEQLDEWLDPFAECLGHVGRRPWMDLYLQGLLSDAPRKSIEPLCERVAPGQVQQLHHFVCASPWAAGPLWQVLVHKAQALLGGAGATLVVDDTPLVKQGRHSVGVARQWCGQLGKTANCQSLLTLTLVRGQMALVVAMELFLPESWEHDETRRAECGVPQGVHYRPKWQMALEAIDRLRAMGLVFDSVVADTGYGHCEEFRKGLQKRRLVWSVGVRDDTALYEVGVQVKVPKGCKRGVPDRPSLKAKEMIEQKGRFRFVTWREGTKGPLRERFARVRVRGVAPGRPVGKASVRLPEGGQLWLVCEERSDGRRFYYLCNLGRKASLRRLVRLLKRHWLCEQAHEQMKQQLGLSHFEGRSWGGLHHHALLVAMAFAFLQHLRLKGKKTRRGGRPQAASGAQPAGSGAGHRNEALGKALALPPLRSAAAPAQAPLKKWQSSTTAVTKTPSPSLSPAICYCATAVTEGHLLLNPGPPAPCHRNACSLHGCSEQTAFSIPPLPSSRPPSGSPAFPLLPKPIHGIFFVPEVC